MYLLLNLKKLLIAKHSAKKREIDEHIRINREAAERRERKEKLIKERHIQKVTCMDLPLE